MPKRRRPFKRPLGERSYKKLVTTHQILKKLIHLDKQKLAIGL